MKKNKQLQKLIQELLDLSFSDGRVIDSKVVKSLKLLKSLPGSQSIFALTEYLKGLRRLQKRYTLYIESPIKLSKGQVYKIKKTVEKKSKVTKVVVDMSPELIAGIRFRIGDQIWEDSILSRIQEVKEVITGGYL